MVQVMTTDESQLSHVIPQPTEHSGLQYGAPLYPSEAQFTPLQHTSRLSILSSYAHHDAVNVEEVDHIAVEGDLLGRVDQSSQVNGAQVESPGDE